MNKKIAALVAVCSTAVLAGSCKSVQTQSIHAGEAPLLASNVESAEASVSPESDPNSDPAYDIAPMEFSSEMLAGASPSGFSAAPQDGERTWHITPYVWFLSIDGTSEINGQGAIIDESFSDIWDQLNFVIEGRVETWKGKNGLFLDFTYAELENDAEAGPVEIDVETDMAIVFAGGGYRLMDQDVTENGQGGLKVDALYGVAYTGMDMELDLTPGGGVDGDEGWFDPIIGLRSRWSFTPNWGASLESIIGGFGAFDGADLVTMNTMLMRRDFGGGKALYFGWRTLDIDYDDSNFELNVNINGPIVGFNWSF